MTPSVIATLVFAVSVTLFVSGRLPMGWIALAVPLALHLTGIIEAQEVFSSLTSPSIILVLAMGVIGAGLFRTGMASWLGRTLFRFCPGERSLVFAVVLLGGVLSGFVSNTGTVAVLMPIVMCAAAAKGLPASRLLIPLAYGATFGGNLSVIGSPGNLIAKDVIEKMSNGKMTVSFFEYAWIGLPLLLALAVFLSFFSGRLVPDRPSGACGEQSGSPGGGVRWKGVLTVAVLILSVVGMVAADSLPGFPRMHIVACLGAMAIVLFGVVSQKEAFASFDLQAVFLLAFMPPLGKALVETGAAAFLTDLIVRLTGGSGPYVLTAVLWIAVWALTQLMSNTATCALFCPIGWGVATSIGADPRAVVISVLVASSVGVCTPLAIPANMLILEPGNLRFRDFFRSGIAVSILAFALSLLLLPRLYPFFH